LLEKTDSDSTDLPKLHSQPKRLPP